MKLEKKRYEDVVILRFVGEFDTFNLPLFSERVDRMIEGGDRQFILDVHLLTFINSSALGYLIKMSKRVREVGGEVVLANPSKFVRKTLKTLGLEAVFPVYETVADAILRYKKGADIGQLDLSGSEQDEALHGAVAVLFREQASGAEAPPNQVGRIVNLYADGLVFRYEPEGPDDHVVGILEPGRKLKLKFRQPFAVKNYWFEMDAEIKNVAEVEEDGGKLLTVRVDYGDVKDEDKKLLEQFVLDQETWRSEVRSD